MGKLKEVLERTNSIFFHLLDSQIPSVLHFIAIKVRLAFLCEAALPNCNTKPVSVLVHVSATTGCPNKFEIKALIKKGADVNKTDCDGKTALHFVMNLFSKNPQKCHYIAETLVLNGAKPNMKDSDNWTPLHTAVRKG